MRGRILSFRGRVQRRGRAGVGLVALIEGILVLCCRLLTSSCKWGAAGERPWSELGSRSRISWHEAHQQLISAHRARLEFAYHFGVAYGHFGQ